MSFDFVADGRLGITAFATAVANNTAVTVQTAELGSGQFTPDGTETALMTPFAPVREFDPVRGAVSGEVLKFDFQDGGTDAYDVGEVGLFDDAGVLLFIGSQPAADGFLFSKGADAISGFSFEYTLATADMPTIDFAGAGYAIALADASTYGLVRRVADDTPTTERASGTSRRNTCKTAIDAIPSASGDASAITHVEASRVNQVGERDTVDAIASGDGAHSRGGVPLPRRGCHERRRDREGQRAHDVASFGRRGNVQVGASAPHLEAGDLVTVVWISPRFWLVGIQPGTAAFSMTWARLTASSRCSARAARLRRDASRT